jgi:hypothetical protein
MDIANLEIKFTTDASKTLTACDELKRLSESFDSAVAWLFEKDYSELFTVESAYDVEKSKVHVVMKPTDYTRGFIDALKRAV